MNCKKCKEKIPDISLYCLYCGAPQKRNTKKQMYQRPDGLFEKIKIINGKRVPFRGKTENEVWLKIAKYKEESEQGPTFKEVSEIYYSEKEKEYTYNSFRGIKSAYSNILEHFGEYRIADIEIKDIKDYYNILALRKYSKKTISNYKIVLSGIFKTALLHFHINHNPTDLVPIPKTASNSTKREPPTELEIKTLFEQKNNPKAKLLLLIACSGLRLGEALALQYKDIDFEKRQIFIDKSVYYDGQNPYIKDPKTESGKRTIPFIDVLLDVIKPCKNQNNFVISADGQNPLKCHQYKTILKHMKSTYNITASPHQWRHLYATYLFESGISVKESQYLLGHADYKTTMDIYTHLRETQLKGATNKLNSYINNTQNTQYCS